MELQSHSSQSQFICLQSAADSQSHEVHSLSQSARESQEVAESSADFVRVSQETAPAVIKLEIINIEKIDPRIFAIDFPFEFIFIPPISSSDFI